MSENAKKYPHCVFAFSAICGWRGWNAALVWRNKNYRSNRNYSDNSDYRGNRSFRIIFVNTHCEWVFLRSLLDGLLACRLLAGCCWVVHNESGCF